MDAANTAMVELRNGLYVQFVSTLRRATKAEQRRIAEMIDLGDVDPVGLVRDLADVGDVDFLVTLAAHVWDYDENLAISMFREAANTGSDAAILALGDALNWMGADSEAITWLQRSLSIQGGDVSWISGLLGESMLRSGRGSERRILELLRRGLESSLRFSLPLATLLIARAEYQEARGVLEAATSKKEYGAALLLGNLLDDHLGDPMAAELAYRSGIDLGDANSAFNMAVMLRRAGDMERSNYYFGLAREMGA